VTDCGEDPRLATGAARPCKRLLEHRALRAAAAGSRAMVVELVNLLDRMEPDVADADRASDEEWIELKARAKEYLASGLPAESCGATVSSGTSEAAR